MAGEITYNVCKELFANGQIDWGTTPVGVLLVDADYVANADDLNVAVISGTAGRELAGTGYSRQTLAYTGGSVVTDAAADVVRLKADNPTWAGIDAGTVHAAVLYHDGGAPATDADRELMFYLPLAQDVVTNGGDFTLEFSGNGVAVI